MAQGNDQLFQIAVKHHQAGRLAEAEAAYRRVLTENPRHADALNLLGVAAKQGGRNAAGIELVSRAIELRPDHAEAHCNLGIMLADEGRFDSAIASFQRAILLNPNYVEAHYNFGNALYLRREYDLAIAECQRAIQLKPDCVPAYNNLGNATAALGQLDEAINCFQRAIQLNPNFTQAHYNLGNALRDKGLPDSAVTAYQRAIELRPRFAQAYNNLAGALKGKAQLDQAIAAYQEAIRLAPNDASIHSNLLYLLYFHPGFGPNELLAEHRRWAARHADSLKPASRFDNAPDPDRPLRVGYVSPNFRDHCQSFFTVPLFRAHNPSQVEIICYADIPRPDRFTLAMQSMCSTWRDITGRSDAAAAAMVHADRIDILVDLTMHMANARPLLFARKPAPIQVCWLAYPGTSGQSAIDYRLTDPFLDPPGIGDEFYTEQSVRLPRSFWCYDALSTEAISPLPAERNGYVTFGCLNNFCKVNDGVLALWAGVLSLTAHSRLILLSPPGDHRSRVLERLRVDPARVEFVTFLPRDHYLRLYHRIDIMLDTFPYNGHTTTLDALWMGVPAVSLVGRTPVGRAGLSILTNAGLEELSTTDAEGFVLRAVELAGDRFRLRWLRETLRPRTARFAADGFQTIRRGNRERVSPDVAEMVLDCRLTRLDLPDLALIASLTLAPSVRTIRRD